MKKLQRLLADPEEFEVGECDARRIEATRTMSEEGRLVPELVRGLIPIVKRRIGVALGR